MPQGSGRWSKTSYGSEYGYNQVWKTVGGHEVQMDNTPGKERMYLRHASGTMTEINFEGNQISMTIGDRKDYNKSGYTMTADENRDCMSVGHCRDLTGGGTQSIVAGQQNVGGGGNIGFSGMGNVNVRAKAMYVGSDTSIAIRGQNIHVKADGEMFLESKGPMTQMASKIDMNPSAAPQQFAKAAGFPNKTGGNSGGKGVTSA